MANLTPVDILKAIALVTGQRLRAAKTLGLTLSEETLTDMNLLEMLLQGSAAIKLWKCPKREEARFGIDWEWFIGNDTDGWYRYAVQAKKLSDGRYRALNRLVRRRGAPTLKQLEILGHYAAAQHAIPLYLFYNDLDKPTQLKIWFQAETAQLGCTLTPLQSVEQILEKHKYPTFDQLYDDVYTIPLYRLLRLPNRDFHAIYQDQACRYARLPDEVLRRFEQPKTKRSRKKTATSKKTTRAKTYAFDVPAEAALEIDIAPRRIMIIEL